jgi:thioredoxin 1
MSNLTPLQTDSFDSQVLKAEKPVLVEFGAPWCGPCKMLEPVLAELAPAYAGRVDFYTVDVDDNPQLAMDYGVMGVPTVILFKSGEPAHRLTGYRPRQALEKAFFADLD